MTSRRLNLSVQYACNKDHLPLRQKIQSWARAALNVDGMRGGQMTVRFVDAEEGQRHQRKHDDRVREDAGEKALHEDRLLIVRPWTASVRRCKECRSCRAVFRPADGSARRR